MTIIQFTNLLSSDLFLPLFYFFSLHFINVLFDIFVIRFVFLLLCDHPYNNNNNASETQWRFMRSSVFISTRHYVTLRCFVKNEKINLLLSDTFEHTQTHHLTHFVQWNLNLDWQFDMWHVFSYRYKK